MCALKKSSNGHDWKEASVKDRTDFCHDQSVVAPLTVKVLRDSLTIFYSTSKKTICDITLGKAVLLIISAKDKPRKT
jgi:hypothetical protein